MPSPTPPAAPDGPAPAGAAGHTIEGTARSGPAGRPGRGLQTSAWPLALAYAVLVVYASLYPFDGWRDQGIAPWAFLTAPLPRWWTGFDVTSNVLGYAPLGFLAALAALRTGRGPRGVLTAVAACALLSLLLESLQSYMPVRVPSNVDLALNAAGATAGAAVAWGLEWLGAIARWDRVRARWLEPESRGALVLLALWPVALLFPVAVPFGLGQVLERLEEALALLLEDTPFLEWMPMREVELQPLIPGAELLCVTLGALVPALLANCIVQGWRARAVASALVLAAGVAATALSSALTYGPSHVGVWLSFPVQVGLATAVVLGIGALAVPRRGCAAVALLLLVVHLNVLNDAPTSAYFAQTLQTWEQGRFIRFHGVVQWLGWVWPYAALGWLLLRVSRRQRWRPAA
ncbi:VanZ family protein [Xylophilus sp. Leaf220]|uniref:VanZ family protein n=1 Tax=Xylophilus sp. Leaf220 TaxID=1735686 RepID=UPI0009E926CE|nr:VanZ family protein [Xylophilus sp. Leaf220]